MSIAYSNLPIAFKPIRRTSSSNLRSDLNTILLSVGWSILSTLTNGFIYGFQSPSLFQAALLVQDGSSYGSGFSSNQVVFQLQSFDGSLLGNVNALQADPSYVNGQVVAGICQLFISVPGVAGTHMWSFACGIPFVPIEDNACAAIAQGGTITQIAWSCGGTIFGFAIPSLDFRWGPNAYQGATFLLNGSITIYPDTVSANPVDGPLCTFTLAPLHLFGVDVEWQQGSPTDFAQTYGNQDPINIDAVIGWKNQMRGEIYDAFVQTGPGTLDDVQQFQDTDKNGNAIDINCIRWHTTQFSSLWLMIEPGPTIVGLNYAY